MDLSPRAEEGLRASIDTDLPPAALARLARVDALLRSAARSDPRPHASYGRPELDEQIVAVLLGRVAALLDDGVPSHCPLECERHHAYRGR
jgi:hypothetical protein